MPCPGPQPMWSIHMFLVPGPIEMQSSPLLIVLLLMVTPVEYCTWMPSVFGLPLGAMILMFWSLMLLLCPMATWIVWLFRDVKPLTTMLLHHRNVIDCIHVKRELLVKLHLKRKCSFILNYTIYDKNLAMIVTTTLKWRNLVRLGSIPSPTY